MWKFDNRVTTINTFINRTWPEFDGKIQKISILSALDRDLFESKCNRSNLSFAELEKAKKDIQILYNDKVKSFYNLEDINLHLDENVEELIRQNDTTCEKNGSIVSKNILIKLNDNSFLIGRYTYDVVKYNINTFFQLFSKEKYNFESSLIIYKLVKDGTNIFLNDGIIHC